MTVKFTALLDYTRLGAAHEPRQWHPQSLRHALGRRRAARMIANLATFGPNVVAFPIAQVGFVEGATAARARPAVIKPFEPCRPTHSSPGARPPTTPRRSAG